MRAARSDQTTWEKPRTQGSSAARLAERRPDGQGSGGGRRPELRAAGAESSEALVEAGPGPRLDLAIPGNRLVPRRLEVLEPRVGLLDLEQLLGFADRPGDSVVVIVHGRDSRTQVGRRCTLAGQWPTIATTGDGNACGSWPASTASASSKASATSHPISPATSSSSATATSTAARGSTTG